MTTRSTLSADRTAEAGRPTECARLVRLQGNAPTLELLQEHREQPIRAGLLEVTWMAVLHDREHAAARHQHDRRGRRSAWGSRTRDRGTWVPRIFADRAKAAFL
jgi:hypothetical protein